MATTTYRVMRITTDNFRAETPNASSLVWEGTCIKELSAKFPPSEIFGADELGFHSIEDGWITWNHVFEMKTDDGDWEQISDPRRRQTSGLTELEDVIEAENRRLYPGDYPDWEERLQSELLDEHFNGPRGLSAEEWNQHLEEMRAHEAYEEWIKNHPELSS